MYINCCLFDFGREVFEVSFEKLLIAQEAVEEVWGGGVLKDLMLAQPLVHASAPTIHLMKLLLPNILNKLVFF